MVAPRPRAASSKWPRALARTASCARSAATTTPARSISCWSRSPNSSWAPAPPLDRRVEHAEPGRGWTCAGLACRRKQLGASVLGHGPHRGVANLALHGDRIEAFAKAIEPCHHAHALLFL